MSENNILVGTTSVTTSVTTTKGKKQVEYTQEKYENSKSKNSYLVNKGNNGRLLLPSDKKLLTQIYNNNCKLIDMVDTKPNTKNISKLSKKDLIELIKSM